MNNMTSQSANLAERNNNVIVYGYVELNQARFKVNLVM